MKFINFFKKSKQIEPGIKYEGIAKYMPLIICGGFYLITILLFAFGPFEWNLSNGESLYIFLFSCFIALILGYLIGVIVKRKKTNSNFDINKIIIVSFILFIVVYILNTYATTGKLYPDIIRGIFNSGIAYKISHSSMSSISTIIAYISIVLAPLTSFIVPLFFIYFKNLSKKSKIIGIMVLVLSLFLGIAQGIINSYATLAFQIVMFLSIYLFSTLKKTSKKEKFAVVFIILLVCFSFLFYYKTVMSNRLIADASDDMSNIEFTNNDIDNETINDMFNKSSQLIGQATLKENYFLSFLPESITGSINHLISYITHGYKGLSLAMEYDFTSSYGLGFSDFFRHNFLKIINKSDLENSIYERTYMSKIKNDGINTGATWASFFIYPASDIGFSSTIFFVFILGYIFSISWRDTLESKNIFASVIFLNICMIICFFSANNAYFQNGGSFITMTSMFILWMLSRLLGKGKLV